MWTKANFTSGGSQNKLPELTRGQQVVCPLLHLIKADVETGRDDAALVETANQINNNFARATIVDNFNFPNVTLK